MELFKMNLLFSILFSIALPALAANEDFYSLLDIDKSATTKDIRKAFKKAALKMHPDKNPDDPEADSKFIKLNRAYEVLKDDELRKKYDQFGEEGLENNNSGHNYQSWSYYRDNFGIYDDDADIITLSKTDFDASVTGSNTPWFINYYHPMCSHCHTLAPDWRWLSFELLGVVRIGAVNCDDEFHLCREQGIRSYPTLIAYPTQEVFRSEKSRENLVSFILGRLPTGQGIPITTGMLHNMREQQKLRRQELEQPLQQPWVVAMFPNAEEQAEYRTTLIKLAAIFSGVVKVGRLDCSLDPNACKKLNYSSDLSQLQDERPLLYYPGPPVLGGAIRLSGEGRAQETAQKVLELLPELPVITDQEYRTRLAAIEQRSGGSSAGWLVQFSSEEDDNNDELRKLAGLAAPLPCHRVFCSSLSNRECDSLFIHKTPAFILFKPGGGYEAHHGRLLAQDIANFAKEAAGAANFRTLTPKEFPSVLSASSHWFVDFYAPWCPPCMRLLPQFRRASVLMQRQSSQPTINFGIVDCTAHSSLCSQFNVHQYPTTILYNNTTPHQYSGPHSPQHIVEFVEDTLNPTVLVLSPASFKAQVLARGEAQVWVVDFFASWCGPCQEMAPEFRRFSRLVRGMANVFVASVDCAQYRDFCTEQGVRSYPTIRLYNAGDTGATSALNFQTYRDHSRDAFSFKRWLYTQLPSRVTQLTDRSFEAALRSHEPWLVDFYAPWCGHCHQFAPDFEDIATNLEGSVKLGKVDCQAYQWLCRGAGISAYPSVVFYKGVSSEQASDGSARQQPTGEPLPSLEPSAILSHVRWRLETQRTASTRSQPRDEL